MLSYENLLSIKDFRLSTSSIMSSLNNFYFLSFQDALHYIINTYNLSGKTILLPDFYCDATLNDMKKHKLNIVRCKTDQITFDVDVHDFQNKIEKHSPDIVLIYYFFGKTSTLFKERSWLKKLKRDTIIISDFAHALIPFHKIEFLNTNHIYIDSTRKTTSCMMANMVLPPGMHINKNTVQSFSIFRYGIRLLFWLKTEFLKIATFTNLKFLGDIGNKLYSIHDSLIGSPIDAFKGFWWDSVLYKHIDFQKIEKHRIFLFEQYKHYFKEIINSGYLQLFGIPEEESKNLCFFFALVTEEKHIEQLLKYLQEQGYWVDTLWDFDVQLDIDQISRSWLKKIIVFPYTLKTQAHHVKHISSLISGFFDLEHINQNI